MPVRLAGVLLFCCAAAHASDWPMWRCDAARTACSTGALPGELHLQWTRALAPPLVAWKDEGNMQFDRYHQPIVLSHLVIVGSTVNDSVTAYDLRNGEERWRFYAEGPIRLAPAGWRDRVFVASDDGCLYALRASDGGVLWSYRPGPSDRRLIGNERLISAWPVRGGPVVAGDRVYLAAGVWPFMGVFVCALDAETGRPAWVNSGVSFVFRELPHLGAEGFEGLSPQGYLAVTGGRLIVPGSRYTPGVFDAASGKFLFFAPGNGPAACAAGPVVFSGGQIFHAESGLRVLLRGLERGGLPVLADDFWHIDGGAVAVGAVKLNAVTIPASAVQKTEEKVYGGTATLAWTCRGTPRIRVGDRLVTSEAGGLAIWDVRDPVRTPQMVSRVTLEGDPVGVVAADGRLIVVTGDGILACYGADRSARRHHRRPRAEILRETPWAGQVTAALRAAGVTNGYGMVWGVRDGGMVEEVLRQSAMHVVAVDADRGRIAALRQRLDRQGLYGVRAAAICGEPATAGFAPYFASLILSEDPDRAGAAGGGEAFLRRVAGPLRPYGGIAALTLSPDAQTEQDRQFSILGLAGYEWTREGTLSVLRRNGPLRGAGAWRGQNADAGNTRCSGDRLVRAPLGVLWFGNALTNDLILPRHGKGPIEQVVGGRLFIEGPDSITAADVYTGRVLWTREFPRIGGPYDTTSHQAGALVSGGNFFATDDAVYVADATACRVLDPATGTTRADLSLPDGGSWQFLLVSDGWLVAGSDFVVRGGMIPGFRYGGATACRRLVGWDRRSGKVLWQRAAKGAFPHNGIAAGREKVFCVDRPSSEQDIGRRAQWPPPKVESVVAALDIRSGTTLWERKDLPAAGLSYAAENDTVVLSEISVGGLETQRVYEARVSAVQGQDGRVLWRAAPSDLMWNFGWGPLVVGDPSGSGAGRIITQYKRSLDLRTGETRTYRHPDGTTLEWSFWRAHGCGPVAAGGAVLTFRSGNAAFYDLATDGGTASLSGFRSGCTPNLIAADGVLNAPDYTRTCICHYANRSSLALVHMPEAEHWTYGSNTWYDALGVNLGAPGDRRGDNGTLWVDYPSVGGASPDPDVKVEPAEVEWFRMHSSAMGGGAGPVWVAASGAKGLREIRIRPMPGGWPAGACAVRLHLAEPDEIAAGQRVFDVEVQGKRVWENLDVVAEAGGIRKSVVKETRTVPADGEIAVRLVPRRGEPVLCGVELIPVK